VRRLFLFSLILLTISGIIFCADFGLELDQLVEVKNDLYTYEAGVTPWFSYSNGRNISLYFSVIFTFRFSGDYSKNNTLALIPEISRFTFLCNFNENISLEAGRMEYNDGLDFIASGLFDGLRFGVELPPGSLSASVFYTGFLYKETAAIVMTDTDSFYYDIPFKITNYGDYFASRRMLAAVSWDMPLEFNTGNGAKLSADILAQFDFNRRADTLHSQYITALMEFYPKDMLRVSGGLLFSMMQNGYGNFGTAFGFLAQCKIGFHSTKVSDLLGITAKATFGTVKNDFNSYTPVSGVPQGSVFEETLSGLALLCVDYNIKITKTLFAQCAVSYFVRTYNVPDEGNFYGGEFFASFGWQPLDDISVFLGGGVFIPGMGNVYPKGTGVMWKVTAGFTLSF